MTDDPELALLTGILMASGSFGGDGKQPQITLRMHTRHEALMRWIEARVPGSKLYGPYHHGGRSYFQWIARGEPLVMDLLPTLEATVTPELDPASHARLTEMTDRYREAIDRIRARADRLSVS